MQLHLVEERKKKVTSISKLFVNVLSKWFFVILKVILMVSALQPCRAEMILFFLLPIVM